MVRAPSVKEEDYRSIGRERKVLVGERTCHFNRIKGLLFAQGITGYDPLRRDRRHRLEELRAGDGRALPEHLKGQIRRELDRLELVIAQIKEVQAERAVLLAIEVSETPATTLLDLKGIGPECAAILYAEGLFRHFDNRRQVAAYTGLAPTLWQSGSVRARGLEGRQPPAANDDDRVVLAVAAQSTKFGAYPLVPRTPDTQSGASQRQPSSRLQGSCS
ncbi:transposase [Mesorhizobium caraganae]|uniref:transposase n=1 Tax=Mesorhizobium caraganae TaxID=483206 RepID=UPI001FEC6A00|nr:transposase [Mesorhizobium caraganae]